MSATATRVTEAQARRRFTAGAEILVHDGHETTVTVTPSTVTHHKTRTSWTELAGLVKMWRNRYPHQAYYVVNREARCMVPDVLRAGRVKTWADGFGRWYAAVPGDLADPRRRARDAIRRELASREDLAAGHVVRVERAPAEWHTTTDPDARPVYREVTP